MLLTTLQSEHVMWIELVSYSTQIIIKVRTKVVASYTYILKLLCRFQVLKVVCSVQ